MLENKKNIEEIKKATFSKDNRVIEISSKQEQINIQSITPPIKPKEKKSE